MPALLRLVGPYPERCRSAVRAAASAARTAAGSAPTAAATWRATVAQRGGRRLLGEVGGHSVQPSTRRSALLGRCFVAQRCAVVRSANGRATIEKMRPERNHAW